LRDPQKAIALLEKAAELQPDQAEIHLGLGNALFHAGRMAEAAVEFEHALRTDPRNFRAANNLGTVLLRSQHPAQAVTAYRKALELSPEYPEALDGLSAALLQIKNVSEADAVLRLFLRVRPDDPRALFKLGWIRAASREDSLRNGGEAESLARKLLELKKNQDPLAHDLLAAALAEQGRFGEARQRMEELLRAVEASPQFPETLRDILQKHLECYRDSRPWRE
jgi:Flp pilus assembly protein TadD